jgi:glucosamine 6-phosphate synthetase-like amidotransferase/phosphosugar isomerase protein
MCGIAAVLLYPQDRKESEWAAIREIFMRNLVFNEERGREASGCAIFGRDGRVILHKMPVNASRFMATPEYMSLLDAAGSSTTLILGHTRLPTRGDNNFASDKHPLEAGPVFGVQNGTIDNADNLFTQAGLPRGAEADSEIIFRLLESISPVASGGEYLAAIRPLIRRLEGKFTFLACDRRRPERLLLLKHNNPLYTHFRPEWNALFISSRYVFLRMAFREDVHAEALPADRLMLFQADVLPDTFGRPSANLPLYEGALTDGG